MINAAGADDLDYLKALKPWMGSSYVTLSPPFLRNTDELGILPGFLKVWMHSSESNLTHCRHTSFGPDGGHPDNSL